MKNIIRPIILLIILSLLIFYLSGCSSPMTAQAEVETEEGEIEVEKVEEIVEEPIVSDEAVTEGPEGFNADGVISSGEYTQSKTIGEIVIYWSTDDEYIYMAMNAETEGYLSIGFGPSQKMMDADMVFGYVEEGRVTVLDLYSTGDFGPHPPDEELGGTNDILEYGGSETEDGTIIEFKRQLVTGDEWDKDLESGTLKVIWAFGNADDLNRSHSKRGSGEIDIE